MKKIKRLLVLAMTLCMTVGLLTIPAHAEETVVTSEDISEFISNPNNAERVSSGVCYIDTRGASDEYYYCDAPTYSGPEYIYDSQSLGMIYLQYGAVLGLTGYALGYIAPASQAAGQLLKVTKWVNSNVIWQGITGNFYKTRYYYARTGSMYCEVRDAMGNLKYIRNYTDLRIPVRFEDVVS